MIQVRRLLHIPVPARRDMEIALQLIPLQAPVNPTRVRDLAPAHARALGKLPTMSPRLAEHMVDMDVLLLRGQPILGLVAERLVLVFAAVQLEVALLHPQHPARVLAAQHVACQDAVAGCVLDVHAQFFAGHVDDDVEV